MVLENTINCYPLPNKYIKIFKMNFISFLQGQMTQ